MDLVRICAVKSRKMDSCKWDSGVIEANAHNKSGCHQNKRRKKFYAIQHHSTAATLSLSLDTIVNNTQRKERGRVFGRI